MENKAQTTTQHEVIKAWVEERHGRPSRVAGTGEKHRRHFTHEGILRIDFGKKEERLEPLSWTEFFKVFDEHRLAFLFQEETAEGKTSHFFKFIARK